MTKRTTIRSPAEWAGSQVVNVAHVVGASGRALHHTYETLSSPAPAVQKITTDDLRDALIRGFTDFAAYRSDVFFLLVFYPILNLLMARVAFGMNLVPLLFPIMAGFALIGPITAVGLYEMSRRREQGLEVSWRNGLDVIHRPAIGGIALLSAGLAAIFVVWLDVAWQIFENTMGPVVPTSLFAFLNDVLSTDEGHAMIIEGMAVGFLFAVVAMAISVVSFPLMVDRDVGLDTAVKTSVRAVMANPFPMAMWGLIVAFGLLIGTMPFFLGLVVVMPVLGHATWHLYRKMVQH